MVRTLKRMLAMTKKPKIFLRPAYHLMPQLYPGFLMRFRILLILMRIKTKVVVLQPRINQPTGSI